MMNYTHSVLENQSFELLIGFYREGMLSCLPSVFSLCTSCYSRNFLKPLIHAHCFVLFIKTCSLLPEPDARGMLSARSHCVCFFLECEIKAQCLSCKHKALYNASCQTVLIIKDNGQKPAFNIQRFRLERIYWHSQTVEQV